jgi:hypothetical protein
MAAPPAAADAAAKAYSGPTRSRASPLQFGLGVHRKRFQPKNAFDPQLGGQLAERRHRYRIAEYIVNPADRCRR